MSYEKYRQGNLVKVSGEFRDQDLGGVVDPDVVKLTVTKPDATQETFVYGDGDEIVRDDPGQYHADINADQAGIWFYYWWSTGNGQGAEEQQFEVLAARGASTE